MKKLNFIFAIIMAFLICLFFLFLLFPPSLGVLASQKSIIFLEGRDWFADFFNVMRYLSDEVGFYFSKINEADGHSGFPIGLAIMYPFTLLADYSNMSLQDCWVSKSAIFSCVMFLIIILFFFWDSLRRICEKYKVEQYNLIIFLFSSLFIFSVERGNSIFFSVVLINYFIVFYDCDRFLNKYFALICLCLAATLKGYPVFFGLLLLKDKRYKDIVFCVGFTLILALVPFAFMERGFENLYKMIENTGFNNDSYIHSFNYQFGIHKLVFLACKVAHLELATSDMIISISRIFESILLLLTFILVLVEDRLWKQILLIACGVVLFPINSGFYCGLYLLPAILIFFQERKLGKIDYFIMLLLCLAINPLQVNLFGLYLTSLVSNASVAFLWVLLLSTSLPKLKGFKLYKRNEN